MSLIVEQLFHMQNIHICVQTVVFKLCVEVHVYVQMAYLNKNAMRVWSYNLPIVSHMQL